MEILNRAPIEQKLGKTLRTITKGVVEVGKTLIMIPVACGYVNFDGIQRNVHDHDGKKRIRIGFSQTVDYDESTMGPLTKWVKEGEKLPEARSIEGKYPIHRHNGHNSSGAHEFIYE